MISLTSLLWWRITLQVEHFAKSAKVMPKTSKGMKNVNNLQKNENV
jgi:hypothetical protein